MTRVLEIILPQNLCILKNVIMAVKHCVRDNNILVVVKMFMDFLVDYDFCFWYKSVLKSTRFAGDCP